MSATEAISSFQLYPATCSSIGMVLLSTMDPKDIRFIYKGKDIPAYPGGIKDLLRDLKKTVDRGYGLYYNPDATISLAVPVGRPCVGAVALAGTIPENLVEENVRHLTVAAESISEKLK